MTNPTETSLRDAFDELLDAEPPWRVDTAAAIRRGRRDARHRLVVRATAAAACLATATAVLATAVHHDATRGTRTNGTAAAWLARTPFRLTAQHGRVAVTQAGPAPSGPTDDAIIAAIRANSPASWTFTFGGGGTDASTVDGTADDGSGPGRVYVYAEGPGMMTREPCNDPDFSSGVSCTETHLGGDAILSVRGLFDYEGVETYEIALTHADGSGVGAEAGNFTLRALPKDVTPTLKTELIHPDHNRVHPTYDASQLAAIVQAVDAAVHGS